MPPLERMKLVCCRHQHWPGPPNSGVSIAPPPDGRDRGTRRLAAARRPRGRILLAELDVFRTCAIPRRSAYGLSGWHTICLTSLLVETRLAASTRARTGSKHV